MKQYDAPASPVLKESALSKTSTYRCPVTQKPLIISSRILTAIFSAWLLVAYTGCNDSKPIRTYRVKRIRPAEPETPKAETVAQAVPTRMLAAIVPHEKTAWYFKVTGPLAEVGSILEPFLALISSIQFDEKGELNWTDPKGWVRGPGDGMVTAHKVAIPIEGGGRPLTMTVTELPIPEMDFDQYILSNVNRWRKQLDMPATDLENLYVDKDAAIRDPNAVLKHNFENGTDSYLVRLDGQSTPGKRRMPPFANRQGAPGQGPAKKQATPPPRKPAEPKLSYDTPEGWKKGASTGISAASFQVANDQKKVAITITPLGKQPVLPNINRWRGQVKLAPISESELSAHMKEIKVGETLTAQVFDIVGPDTEKAPQTILAAIIDQDNMSWFVKLHGDNELAAKEKENFEAFVRSLRFK